VLKREERLDEALIQYRLAIRIKPTYAAAYTNAGNVLLEQGHVSDAIQYYHTALRIAPALPEASHNLAIVLWHQKYDKLIAIKKQEAERAAASANRNQSGTGKDSTSDQSGSHSGDERSNAVYQSPEFAQGWPPGLIGLLRQI